MRIAAPSLAASGVRAVPPADVRYGVLDVQVSAVDMTLAVERIGAWVRGHDGKAPARYVCVRDVNGIVESWKDPALADIHNRAGMVTPDGMPLVWLGRLAGHQHVDRVYGPDLMLALCAAKPGYRHFFYGGGQGVADLLVARLRERFPQLNVAGTFTPPFRPLSEAERIETARLINAARPDIVWVGLSSPKQERWMAEMAPLLQVPVLIGVGAAFDFHAGLKPQAPRWIQRSGLEWLFRLATEPRRLWKRYLVGIPLFTALVTARALQGDTAASSRRQG